MQYDQMVTLYFIDPQSVDLGFSHYLSDEEEQKAQRFHFEKDEQLYRASHIALRQILSSYTEQNPQDIQFIHNQYGKPFLQGANDLVFNLSHTQSAIVCAVLHHENALLGVDVEQIRSIPDLPSLCEYAFHPQEAQRVLALDSSQQQDTFYTYWTLKEAYIKAIGMGLSKSLQSFYFQQDTAQQWQVITSPEADSLNTWHIWSMFLGANYKVALAIQAKEKPNLKIVSELAFS